MESVLRILHLEDDLLDSELVEVLLRKERLTAEIDRVETLGEFQEALGRQTYSLILSDYTVPGTDPMDALRLARQMRPEIPFLFLSGTLGEDLAIEMLKQGASDYVLKQRIARLVPAVRRALQEAEEQARRKQAEEDLKTLNATLEQRVVERTAVAERRAAQLQVLAAELTQAEERERHRLVRVLHDHLQQLLVAAQVRLSPLCHAPDPNTAQTASQVDELLTQCLAESRSLTVQLSPPVLYDAGLAAGLGWLARQVKEKHGLHVDVVAAPETEPCDEAILVFLFQAVRELLLNVVKHARAKAARVELTALDRNQIRLVVADQGKGFDLTTLETHRTTGGLGLFSIRERLELLGGRVAIDSAPRRGTRIVIEVPRSRLPMPAELPSKAAAPAQAERTGTPAEAAPGTCGRLRVLLADDHPVLRHGLAGLLHEHDEIEVVGEAADGREAVDLALQTRPDVILMDITMPGLSGIEATRRILEVMPQVRVIGLSMHEEADMAAAMLRAGAVVYLRKDTASNTLIATILAQRVAAR